MHPHMPIYAHLCPSIPRMPLACMQACPFPGVVALLLHRIKADLAAEKRRYHLDLGASSEPEQRRGSHAAAFAPAQIAEIAKIVQVVEEPYGGSDPSTSLLRPRHIWTPHVRGGKHSWVSQQVRALVGALWRICP